MYTRCPSCRSEISFDPPANKDSLPENYRHRIKCPSCGVTIGVKINQSPQILSQPVGRPQLAPPPGARTSAQRQNTARTNAYSAPRANTYNQPRANGYGQPRATGYGQQPRANGYAQQPRANSQRAQQQQYDPYQYQQYPPYTEPVKEAKGAKSAPAANAKNTKAKTKQNVKANVRTDKKAGALRNLTMMIFSLIFVAFSVISYLITAGTLKLSESLAWLGATSYFDGISVWASMITDFNGFRVTMGSLGALGGFATIVPLLLFTLSCVNFIVAFVSLCGKKYGRAFNAIFSLILGGLAILALFGPYLMAPAVFDGNVGTYFKAVTDAKAFIAIIGAVIGVLQVIFALIFTKSMYRKDPELPAKNGKGNAKKQPAKNAKAAKGRR